MKTDDEIMMKVLEDKGRFEARHIKAVEEALSMQRREILGGKANV